MMFRYLYIVVYVLALVLLSPVILPFLVIEELTRDVGDSYRKFS